MGDGGTVAYRRVQGLLLPAASMILQRWVPEAREAGAPFDIASAYELLRQQCRGMSEIVDALCVGQRSPHWAGNIAAVNETRSSHTLASHLVDITSDNENPVPPTLHVYQSVFSETGEAAMSRPMVMFERISNGSVTHARAMLEFRKRLENGAADDAAYIEDARSETFSIRSDGTYFTRGGIFVLGDSAHVILRGGNVYAEDLGVVAVLGPDTTTDSATGASLALGRISTTVAQIGDIYGIDIGTLNLQASVVRAVAPGGVDSAFRSKGIIFDTDPLPDFFTAGNRGLGWDSDDDKLKKWDGSAYTEVAVVGAAPAAHAILDSTVHSDTLTGTLVRGDVLVVNSTPKLARVAVGTAGQVFTSDGTDAAWAAPAATAGMVRTLNTETSTVGTGSSTQTDLHAYSLPANTLDTDGDAILIEAHGQMDRVVGSGQLSIRLRFGATDVALISDSGAGNDGAWKLEALITRRSAGNQVVSGWAALHQSGNAANGLVTVHRVYDLSTTEDETGALDVKIIGDDSGNPGGSGLDSRQMMVTLKPAP